MPCIHYESYKINIYMVINTLLQHIDLRCTKFPSKDFDSVFLSSLYKILPFDYEIENKLILKFQSLLFQVYV